MSRYGLAPASTLEDIDNFFSLKPIGQTSIDSAAAQPPEDRSRRLPRGRLVDDEGNPIGPDYHKFVNSNRSVRERARFPRGTEYVSTFRKAQEHQMNQLYQDTGRMNLDDAATLDQLETRSMTSTTVSTVDNLLQRDMDVKISYRGYRPAVYDDSLPITKHRQKIINTIESTQCTIIEGMTGCGKTTQVPQYILDHYAANGKYCKIAVTQPRRIAAISVAKRVCAERGWTSGTYCGYQVARDSNFDADKTMITYMTTGVLLQKLIGTRNLNNYTHVILDEVHERDQDTDLALLIVRKFIRTVSPQVKVILMSATFQCELFASYFAGVVRGQIAKAPVINVEGRMHEVQLMYWSDPLLRNTIPLPRFDETNPMVCPEAIAMAVRLLSEFDRIENEEQKKAVSQGQVCVRGSVLVFLPGLAEIQELSNSIEKDSVLKDKKLMILPLHSSITLEEQRRVFDTPHPYYRKVILSTNIAESSITVPDIKYVIDFCLTKCLQTDPDTNMTCLRLEWASKANCKQRMGRAGRVSNGRAYRLVHKEFYVNHLLDFSEPEMKRCPLSQLILRVKRLGPEEPRALLALALDPPDMEDIRKAILRLKEAGALAGPTEEESYNPYDGKLTLVGKVLASLPLNIELGKLLVFGHMLGLLPECLIIAASLHTRSIFKRPFRKTIQAFTYKLKWDKGIHSDPIATVNAYQEWNRLREQEYFMRARNAEDQWCYQNYLQKKTLHEVKEVIDDLKGRLEDHGITCSKRSTAAHLRTAVVMDAAQKTLLLKVALACAFYPHYFTHSTLDEYEATKMLSGKSPLNTVYIMGLPNNEGILYKKQVEDMIKKHVPSADIQVSFENTRGYLEFGKSQGDCSRIPNGVYISLHLARLKERLELFLYDERQASKAMHQISELQQQTAMSEGRLNTNRMFLSTDSSVTEPKAQNPPSGMISAALYLVVYIVEFGHFWCHELDEEKMIALEKLQDSLNRPENLAKAMPVLNPAVGMLCAAVYENSWFRARVEAIHGDEATVFFPDYGNRENVSLTQIKELLPMYRQLAFQAIECKLAFLKPPRSSPNGQYSDIAHQVFANLLLNNHIYCHIFSVDRGVLRLDKVSLQNQNVYIHDLLISKSMAERGEESFASVQNNMMRQKELGSEPSDSNSWGFGLQEMPDLRTSGRTQKLSGPFSPIEMKFYSLSAVGAMKEVKIEPNSVNAIALDEEPGDNHDRLMVSATMSVSSSGGKVIARETTLMPNIHGLPAIMCLLFAPTIQIRSDAQKRHYTGALCGLGCDPVTGDSAYPDHDIEVEFDSKIDLEDITMVNNVRMRFNYCLGSDNDMIDTETLHKVRPNIIQTVLQLLKKPRVTREKIYAGDRLCWLDQTDVLSHNLEGTSADDQSLYRLIKPPILESDGAMSAEAQSMREREEYLKEHCRTLTRLAATSVHKPLSVVCELCGVQVSNTKQLTMHLDSRMHKKLEYNLFPSRD